ncbi:molecular chaperone HtpG [Velocimicrobium porci]|uniref:Molecular chaperone HtpG n=1 Tax=Velocimicrobium porci TaxID=2606634 RepID=A0A6L5Y072_9FIRM|nr:molecular chaperone HtpG [Velocimicrobium porci]MSS64269.1 molecular chaperone HtpG [Velocimicrobium porci]
MSMEQGSLSINSENIFPIIKKWLYSDHDIFVRELVSNGCDAITKLKKLELMGEATIPEDVKFKVDVEVNPEEKTLTFTDNGVGMTADEVKEYINQIAFSGATDFLEKYKDKASEDQIIGHFGLGFYSAFMVADKVTIDTLSYKEGAESVHWESEGGTEFAMDKGEKAEVGTTITLYLNEDSYEFSNEYRIREILTKYCSFMPVEIYLTKANAEPEYETIDASEVREDDVVIENIVEEAKTEEKENENGEKEVVEVSPRKEKAKIKKRPVSLSDTTPLWTKHPNECTEEEYKEFYRNVFHDYKEPLFWIHLNMDYPFNLKGILYFPKLNTEYDNLEGVIKLYNNQVFIADNIKEVIPEFLMLLKGVIDCPDLPLNVSRSALQNDGFVKKISDYITKKVADKLIGMYKVDRENYEKYWDDISPFIKYGCLKDDKFRDKMKEVIIFKNLEEKYITLPEYVEAQKDGEAEEQKAEDATVNEADNNESEAEKEEEPAVVYYVTDLQQQSQYINMFKEQGLDALILTHNIDQPFITQLEQGDLKVRFQRIDADVTDTLKEDVDEEALKEETDTLTEVFKKALGKENLLVKVEKLKNESIASMITLSEESRRMQDMMKMYAMGGMDPAMFGGQGETLVLNANNQLVQYIFEHKDGENVDMFCQQLYDLALLSNKPLTAEAMTNFIARSNKIMMLLAK